MNLQDENTLLEKRIGELENELVFMKNNLFDALMDNDSLRDEVHELEDKLKERWGDQNG